MSSILPAGASSKGFIRRARDLVELYYGARMVTDVIETSPNFSANAMFQILPVDPRRISYDIIVANFDAAPQSVTLGTLRAQQAGTAQVYNIVPGATQVVRRNFLGDLDQVTNELWCVMSSTNPDICVRQVVLQPLPVDETP